MALVEEEIDSKKSAAQKAEEMKQTATGVAGETMERIQAIETAIREASVRVRNIENLKELETQIQVNH